MGSIKLGKERQKKVAAELLAIHKKKGRVEPADVVEYARDSSTELHSLIPWDDKEAAAKYRLLTARWIIRAVRFDRPSGGSSVPMFVHIELEDGDSYYQKADVAVANRDEWSAAVNYALDKLSLSQRSVEELRILAEAYSRRSVKRKYVTEADGLIKKAIGSLSRTKKGGKKRQATPGVASRA